MRNSKKTDFYFRVLTETKYYYSCVVSETYEQAKRRLLFACFSHLHDQKASFKSQHPDVEERYEILNRLYSHRIQDTTKEIYEEKDRFQND